MKQKPRHSTVHPFFLGQNINTLTELVKSLLKDVRLLNKIHIHKNTVRGHILFHKIFNGGDIMQK